MRQQFSKTLTLTGFSASDAEQAVFDDNDAAQIDSSIKISLFLLGLRSCNKKFSYLINQ